MQIEKSTSETIVKLAQGAGIGMVFLAIAGQFFPGYMLDSNAKTESAQARQSAIDAGAGLLCLEFYRSAPDSEAKLVALRAGQSYAASRDTNVLVAAEKAIAVYSAAKVTPEPYKYGVQSSCGEQLHKAPAATAAKL